MKLEYRQKIKKGLTIAITTYAILGNLYALGQDTTGHRSSDIYLEKSEPTKLEKLLVDKLEPIFQKRQ